MLTKNSQPVLLWNTKIAQKAGKTKKEIVPGQLGAQLCNGKEYAISMENANAREIDDESGNKTQGLQNSKRLCKT